MTDIQINQQTPKKEISTVAKKANLTKENLEFYGDVKAKIRNVKGERKGKLILVTAINPTRAGEGKTTTSIGLNEGMRQLGHNSILALREPSLGPVFGNKGGATGGGHAQVMPLEDINLHFTGDMHAITSANNLISSVIDNTIYWGNKLKIEEVIWKRCLDLNDRSLRTINTQIKKTVSREDHFQITAASEIMAILSLSKDMEDLRSRIDNIIFGYDVNKKPLFVKQLDVTGSVMALLKEAIKPNLVQTLEHNPAIIHGGPFANIAHGCNSIIATDVALKVSDYVITEAGFGSDLGAEKFLNIKTRVADLNPNAVVLVATIRALKENAGIEEGTEIELLANGIKHLEKHYNNLKNFNVNVVVALNKFSLDTEEEVALIKEWANKNNVPFSLSNGWELGGKGTTELAELVIENLADKPVKFTYEKEESIKEKISKVTTQIYGAANVEYSEKAEKFIEFLEANNLDKQYICMAKTPASISDDPKLKGVPTGFTVTVNDVTVSNGAGMIVVHCGSVMTMPGLGRSPQATKIDVVNDEIIGLD